MNLKEMKVKVLGMIEELNPDSELLTDDPDIATKINEVVNQVMFEMARMKKIPKYVEMKVSEGDIIDFAKLEKACGYEVYQINMVGGVDYVLKANGTIVKVLESGTAEVELYVYPERIMATTLCRPHRTCRRRFSQATSARLCRDSEIGNATHSYY